MAKQRQPPERSGAEVSTPSEQTLGIDADLAEQLALGNAALIGQMHGGGASVTVGADAEIGDGGFARSISAVAATASAMLALTPRPPAEVERWTAIVQGSLLPDERKQAIIERLQADQEMAFEVRLAAERLLSAHDDAGRSGWMAAFERVVALPEAASPGGPEAVGALIASVGTPPVHEPVTAAVAFCRAAWALWRGDEEEEELPAGYAMESGG